MDRRQIQEPLALNRMLRLDLTKEQETRLAQILLMMAFIIAVVLRLAAIQRKKTISHDEGITYLSATCHQGSYAQAMNSDMVGRLVKASDWKRFINREDPLCFRQIGHDLGHYDIHPPLYFWCLHLWSLIFGIHLYTGPLLNTFIALISLWSLSLLAHRVLGSRLEASIVALIWASSPAVMLVTFDARPYDLFALFAILYVQQTINYMSKTQHGIGFYFLFALLTAGGMLTHYHFAILVAGCCILVFIMYRRSSRWLALFKPTIAGCVLSLILHPYFFTSWVGQRSQAQVLSLEELAARGQATWATYLYFFHGDFKLIRYRYALVILAASLAIWGIWTFRQMSLSEYRRQIKGAGAYILWVVLWLVGTNALLYLSFVSPAHAMGARYLSMVWPFWAFLPVLVLRLFWNMRGLMLPLLCALLITCSSYTILYSRYINPSPDPTTVLNEAKLVIIDNLARGIFIPFVWHVPDDTLVLATTQEQLLQSSEWLQYLRGQTAIFISDISYGNTRENQERIFQYIARRCYRVLEIEGGIWGVGTAYRIVP